MPESYYKGVYGTIIPFENVDYMSQFNRAFNGGQQKVVHLKTGKRIELHPDDAGKFEHAFAAWMDRRERMS